MRMRSRKAGFLTCLCLLLSALLIYISTSSRTYHELVSLDEVTIPPDPLGRAEWQHKRLRDPSTNEIPPAIRIKELAFAKQSASKQGPSRQYVANQWQQRGPDNIGGRTRALAIDAADENTLIAGASSGGIWKSIDAGVSWVQTTNPSQYLSLGSIAQDTRPGKTNTWYVGTGEYQGSVDRKGAAYSGNGIFKSVDNGDSWKLLESTKTSRPWRDQAFDQVWRVQIDPSNSEEDEVYAAALGLINRSTDGGDSWQTVLGSINNYSDVVVTSTGIVYAVVYDSVKVGQSFWRSENGVDWVNIDPVGWPGSTMDRSIIAVAPSNENVVYVVNEGISSNSKHGHTFWKYTYLSGDGSGNGGLWEDRSQSLPDFGGPVQNGGNFSSYNGYCMALSVKPDDENTVLLGGVSLYRSTNGFKDGSETILIGGRYFGTDAWTGDHHADQHMFVFPPSNPDMMYSASDGGVHRTYNMKTTPVHWVPLNESYITTQFYSVGVNHKNPDSYELLGGTQDNGTWYIGNLLQPQRGQNILGGDGAYVAMAEGGLSRYASTQNGRIERFVYNEQGFYRYRQSVWPIALGEFQFIHPFIIDPNDNSIMYTPARNRLLRNKQLSTLEFGDSAEPYWEDLQSTAVDDYGIITNLTASTANPANRVYYGTELGEVYRVDNANGDLPDAINITSPEFPDGYVSSLAVDPVNGDHVLVAFSNYSIQSLFVSMDAGRSWTPVGGNLEEEESGAGNGPSARWVEILSQEGKIPVYLVGTSTGLYAAEPLLGANTIWTQEGEDVLGNVVVDMIDSRQSDGFIAVGTHGRGLFTTFAEPLKQAYTIQGRITEAGRPLERLTVEVTRADGRRYTTETDNNGVYEASYLHAGEYTVTPLTESVEFSPASQSLTLDGNITPQIADFEALDQRPRLVVSDFELSDELRGNQDKIANPGELVYLDLDISNLSVTPIDQFYMALSYSDAFVVNDAFNISDRYQGVRLSGETNEVFDIEPIPVFISSDTPEGHVLTVPVTFYTKENVFLTSDTLRVTVQGADQMAPWVLPEDIRVFPSTFLGSYFTMVRVVVYEPGPLSEVYMQIYDASGAWVLAEPLIQSGSDFSYAMSVSLPSAGEFTVEIVTVDVRGNTSVHDRVRFTAGPFESVGDVLIVADNDRNWVDPYGEQYQLDLEEQGTTYSTWETWQRNEPKIDVLSQFDKVFWYTGTQQDPISELEQAVLTEYLEEGGRLILAGDHVAQALTEKGEAQWMKNYLKSGLYSYTEVPDDPVSIVGKVGHPISDGLSFSLDTQTRAADVLIPEATAIPILFDAHVETTSQGAEPARGISFVTENSRVVFLGFEPARIVETDQRAALIEKSLAWLEKETVLLTQSPALSLPADSARGVAIPAMFDWQSLDGATSYIFQLSTEETFASQVTSVNQLTEPRYSLELPLQSTFYWRVKATNGDTFSPWSTPRSFVSNAAPELISSPLDFDILLGDPFTAIDLAALFVDLDGDPLQYTITLSDESILEDEVVASVLQLTPLAVGEVTVTIEANDRKGGTASTAFNINVSELTGLSAVDETIPLRTELYTNYPNPFSGRTKIPFDVSSSSYVELAIFNATGQHVATLLEQTLSPGRYEVSWLPERLPSGIYFCRLKTGEVTHVQRLVVVR